MKDKISLVLLFFFSSTERFILELWKCNFSSLLWKQQWTFGRWESGATLPHPPKQHWVSPLPDFWFPDCHSVRAPASPGKKPTLSKLISSTFIIFPVNKVLSYYSIAQFSLIKGVTSRYITLFFALRECLLASRQEVKEKYDKTKIKELFLAM